MKKEIHLSHTPEVAKKKKTRQKKLKAVDHPNVAISKE